MKKQEINRLWVLVNKLRGAFDTTELYKIILYALLFKYLELKKDEIDFYDEKFSLGYLSLTYGKLIYSGNLAGYLTEVEKFYNIEYGVLCETIDPILYKADEDSVRHIFEAVNFMEIKEQKDLYEIAKQIVERMSLQTRRISNFSYSSESLAKLEKAILNIQDGMKVYDGYCGSGLSVNEAAAGKGIVYLQDLSVQIIGIAAIITILSGNKIGSIKCGDSILNPISINDKYDRIVVETPLKVKYKSEYLMHIEEKNVLYSNSGESETIGIRHAIARLNEDGIAIALVPMGILFRSMKKTIQIRELLVADKYVDSIVELPAGIIPNTGVAAAFVIFKKNKKSEEVFMINAKDFFVKDRKAYSISDKKVLELMEILQSKKDVKNVSTKVKKKKLKENDYDLCPQRYIANNPMDDLIIENTEKMNSQYKTLKEELKCIEKNLDIIRKRLI